MTDAEKASYLEGEIVVLSALLRAMIASHPNPQKLLADFEERFQAALSGTVPTTVGDSYLEGMHAARRTLVR